MATLVVTGAQWGDEAKGKLVDVLAEWANVVVRYNGGANAGHTVQVGENVYKFHLIPTGVLRPNLLSIVSSGVVIEPKALILEMAKLGQGQVTPNNFKISSNAHVVLPYHQLTEQIDEKSRGDEKIGTTNRGIGPTYVDKTARSGIRMIDFIDPARFKNKLTLNLEIKNRLFEAYGEKPFSVDELLAEYLLLADQLRPYVADIEMLIHDKVAKGDNVLFEGAQGTLLDLDYGTYPYVTSSHPVAAGACLGTGIGPTQIKAVLGVAKAYTTRVGSGPFPTELLDATGEHIREVGHEYGTTTGRARRCGWLDLVALKYAAKINGLTSLAITRLDVLDSVETLSVCKAYKIGNSITEQFCSDIEVLSCAEPIFEIIPGWQSDTTKARKWNELPTNARAYLEFISNYVGVPVSIASIGPERTETIIARPELLWG